MNFPYQDKRNHYQKKTEHNNAGAALLILFTHIISYQFDNIISKVK